MFLVFVLIGLALYYRASCVETVTNGTKQEQEIMVSKIVSTIEKINYAQSVTSYTSKTLEDAIKRSNDLIVRCKAVELEELTVVELKRLNLIEFIRNTCAITKEYKDIHVKSFEYMLKHAKEVAVSRMMKLYKSKRHNTLETVILCSIEEMVNENADAFINQDDNEKLEDVISQTIDVPRTDNKRAPGLIEGTKKANGRFVLTY